MLIYQFIITALLVLLLSCSSDKNENYAEKLLGSQQAQVPTPQPPAVEEPEVGIVVPECTLDQFDSIEVIKKQSKGPFFQFAVYSKRAKKTIIHQAHDFAQLNQTLNQCRDHVEKFSDSPFKCVDINGDIHDFKKEYEYCRSLELRNTHDDNFNRKRKLYRDGNPEFLSHLSEKVKILKKYKLDGYHFRNVKKVEVIVRGKIEKLVEKSSIIFDGMALDNASERAERLSYKMNDGSDQVSDAALITCQLKRNKTSRWQWINLYESFESASVAVVENNKGMVSTSDDSASKVKIYPKKSFTGNYERAFMIECRAQVPELLTIENINKTLESFIRIKNLKL